MMEKLFNVRRETVINKFSRLNREFLDEAQEFIPDRLGRDDYTYNSFFQEAMIETWSPMHFQSVEVSLAK